MALYTVHLPLAAKRQEALERAVLIKEGFSWPAFLFSGFWLLWHRLWVAGVTFFVADAALGWVIAQLPLPGWSMPALNFLLAIAIGLEGPSLRRHALERRNYRLAGVFGGRDREEAERKAIASLAADAKITPPARTSVPGFSGRGGPDVIGLFPNPGASR